MSKDNGATDTETRVLDFRDGTPASAAYRAVAEQIRQEMEPGCSFAEDVVSQEVWGPEAADRWRAVRGELERIRSAMWAAGTCGLGGEK